MKFQWNLNFVYGPSKDTQMSNFMKIPPLGFELNHADGRTDMTKLIVIFWNFAEAPKNQTQINYIFPI
jgi:hypothetical protein